MEEEGFWRIGRIGGFLRECEVLPKKDLVNFKKNGTECHFWSKVGGKMDEFRRS